MDSTLFSLGICAATLIAIAVDRPRRPYWALLGAVLLWAVWPDTAWKHVDLSVLGLYVGTALVTALLKQSGVSRFLALGSARLVRGRPVAILVVYALLALVFGALWGSVTAMVLLVPISLLVTVELDISAVPFLVTEALAASWGALLTSTSDPMTMVIAATFHIDWLTWFLTLGAWVVPLVVALLLATSLLYRRSLRVTNERRARILAFDALRSLPEPAQYLPVVGVCALVVVGYATSRWTGVPPVVVALAGGALLLLWKGRSSTEALAELDWGTVFLMGSLFVLVGGLLDSGLMARLAGLGTPSPVAVLWLSAVVAAVLDQTTAALLLAPVLGSMPSPVALWLPLALGIGLGGAATLLGSAAAAQAASLADKSRHRLSFWGYGRTALAVTAVGLIAVTLLLAR